MRGSAGLPALDRKATAPGEQMPRKARASPAPIAVDRPDGSDRCGACPRLPTGSVPAPGKPIC